jgi:hypothetical protein
MHLALYATTRFKDVLEDSFCIAVLAAGTAAQFEWRAPFQLHLALASTLLLHFMTRGLHLHFTDPLISLQGPAVQSHCLSHSYPFKAHGENAIKVCANKGGVQECQARQQIMSRGLWLTCVLQLIVRAR